MGFDVHVVNSTLTSNAALRAGAIYSRDTLDLTHATVVENEAALVANVLAKSTSSSFGSVVAQPQGGGLNCYSADGAVTHGHNFSDDDSCGFTAVTDTERGDDPGLLALDDFGGDTPTRPPMVASPPGGRHPG
ncbi:MAG: hypothetical protein U5K30_03125 [Acidimicrobiales bacterium]|nr:hypothetical protein [Acidimicrobiales bacterium]